METTETTTETTTTETTEPAAPDTTVVVVNTEGTSSEESSTPILVELTERVTRQEAQINELMMRPSGLTVVEVEEVVDRKMTEVHSQTDTSGDQTEASGGEESEEEHPKRERTGLAAFLLGNRVR